MLKKFLPPLILLALLYKFPQLAYFIILLLVLIFVHELGHFLAAKLAGVGVETFSLGFPPKAWSRTIGGTEYQLAWLPLGGYVKMFGEDPAAAGEIAPELRGKSYLHRKPATKALIALAGPVFNLLFAVFLFWGLIWFGGVKRLAPVLGPVSPGGPAALAGLRMDDRLLAIDGRPVAYFDALPRALEGGAVLELTIGRAGQPDFTVRLTPRPRETRDLFGEPSIVFEAGVSPRLKPIVERASPGSPAEAAGVLSGDVIVAIDGRPTPDWADVLEAVRGPGEPREPTVRPAAPAPLTLTVERGGRLLDIALTPALDTSLNQDGEITYHPRAGLERRQDLLTEEIGFFRAAAMGFMETFEMIRLTALSVKKIFSGQVSVKTLGGPILIAEVAGERARDGLESLLSLAVLISVNLGILNLLPLPVLDGGQILFFILEALRGRPLSLRFREAAQWAGVVALGLLMALVFYNDIGRLIARHFPSAPAEERAPEAR